MTLGSQAMKLKGIGESSAELIFETIEGVSDRFKKKILELRTSCRIKHTYIKAVSKPT